MFKFRIAISTLCFIAILLIGGPGALFQIGDKQSNQEPPTNGESVEQEQQKPRKHTVFSHDPAAISRNPLAPEWVREGMKTEDGNEFLVVQTDGMQTRIDAYEAILPAMMKTIRQHIDSWIGQPGASSRIKLDADYLRDRLVVIEELGAKKGQERYEVHEFMSKYPADIAEQIGEQYGDFFCGYAHLKFDREFRAEIMAQWDKVLTRQRLMITSCLAIGFFSLLAVVFGYLRLNHLTRGIYTGRLQTIAIIASILVVIASVATATYLQF